MHAYIVARAIDSSDDILTTHFDGMQFWHPSHLLGLSLEADLLAISYGQQNFHSHERQ